MAMHIQRTVWPTDPDQVIVTVIMKVDEEVAVRGPHKMPWCKEMTLLAHRMQCDHMKLIIRLVPHHKMSADAVDGVSFTFEYREGYDESAFGLHGDMDDAAFMIRTLQNDLRRYVRIVNRTRSVLLRGHRARTRQFYDWLITYMGDNRDEFPQTLFPMLQKHAARG